MSNVGTATVEAVVALPVFVILFVGVCFLRNMTEARLTTDQLARRCAWEYSNNGCKDVPAGCDRVFSEVGLGEINMNVGDALRAGADSFVGSGDGKAAIRRVLEWLVVNLVTQAFTKSIDAKPAVERERPGLFGGGRSRVQGRYRLACNLPRDTQGNVAQKVWDQFR